MVAIEHGDHPRLVCDWLNHHDGTLVVTPFLVMMLFTCPKESREMTPAEIKNRNNTSIQTIDTWCGEVGCTHSIADTYVHNVVHCPGSNASLHGTWERSVAVATHRQDSYQSVRQYLCRIYLCTIYVTHLFPPGGDVMLLWTLYHSHPIWHPSFVI